MKCFRAANLIYLFFFLHRYQNPSHHCTNPEFLILVEKVSISLPYSFTSLRGKRSCDCFFRLLCQQTRVFSGRDKSLGYSKYKTRTPLDATCTIQSHSPWIGPRVASRAHHLENSHFQTCDISQCTRGESTVNAPSDVSTVCIAKKSTQTLLPTSPL